MENSETGDPVPDKSLKGFFVRKNKKLLLITGAFVLVGLALVFALLGPDEKKPSVTPKSNDVVAEPPKFVAPTEEYEKTVYEADQLFIKQDYDGAIKRLESAIPGTTDQARLYTLKSKIGYGYKAKSDLGNAIKWFEEAQKTGQPAANSLYPEIAEAAEKLGDKQKAIAAYKKAIEILNANPSQAAKNIAATYQAKIKDLGGS